MDKNKNNYTEIRSELQEEISNALKGVDKRYYSQDFKLMTEIINVFGDNEIENIKCDILNLDETIKNLDRVIKKIVEKHSDIFYKILGSVRNMKTMLEDSKQKYEYATQSLSSIQSSIKNLSVVLINL